MLSDLLPDIQSEMARHMYFFVPEHRKCWYHDDNQPLFGAAVADAFPDASPEIGEAGRCYALAPVDRLCIPSNAALEIALHMWARELGVDQFSAIELENWKNILDAAAKKVKELEQQPKGSTKDTELQYYGETTAHFRSVKDAWRNHVSHARTTYDEREATSILNHVREFMDLLAGRPHS